MPGKIWSKKGKCNMKRRGLKFLALSISAALLVGTLAACGSKKDSASKSSGDNSFVITLYPDVAPITCENFEKLVKDGFYDGLKFHRVVEDFMAQAVTRRVTVPAAARTPLKVNSLRTA